MRNDAFNDVVMAFELPRAALEVLGARPMRDTVERLIGDAVVTQLLANHVSTGLLTVDEATDHLHIRAHE